MIFNENDKNIKKVNEDIKSTFIDEIFNEYFSENNGFFKIHDKKQQKIPVMNIYKVKNWEYSDIDIFILDIALGLYSNLIELYTTPIYDGDKSPDIVLNLDNNSFELNINKLLEKYDNFDGIVKNVFNNTKKEEYLNVENT